MGKKAVKQDLILKGLDPRTAVVGADGLFTAPVVATNNVDVAIIETGTDENQPRNALVQFVESATADTPKTTKAKKAKKPKVDKSTEELMPDAE